MSVWLGYTLWSLALVFVCGFYTVLFYVSAQAELSAPTRQEQGNGIVAEAQSGYHTLTFCTVVVAHLSPLGETIDTVLRQVIPPWMPGLGVDILSNAIILGAYSLLSLVGIIIVYARIRPLYLQTTDKQLSFEDGVIGLVLGSLRHFAPAYIVLLVTAVGRWPIPSGLVVLLVLIVGVPILREADRWLVDTRPPTPEERDLITSGTLPSAVDVQVLPDDIDNHHIGFAYRLPGRPQVLISGDAVTDLSNESLRTLLQVGHEQTGWKHTLKARVPVGVWVGLTTVVLIQLQLGFLLSLGIHTIAYLVFAFVVARHFIDQSPTVPDNLSEEQVVEAFEEFAETRRVPLEGYLDPDPFPIDSITRDDDTARQGGESGTTAEASDTGEELQ